MLEVGRKEARRPRRRKTRRPNLNAQTPLLLNTPENTTLLNLLEERWKEGLLEMAAIGGISTDNFEGNGVEGGADVDDDEYGW